MRWLVVAAISIRLVASAALVFGPWTNSANELSGWDVERFQQIAEADGRPWLDHEIEYPPGSVAVIEVIARPTVVGTHRMLVLVSLVMDGITAAAVTAIGGRRAGGWYLLLGLPLVPMGLLRLDLWSVAPAVLAMAALGRRRPRTFAVLATLAALVKAWPVLLLAPAVALRRHREALWAVAVMALSGVVWIGWAGWSLEPVSQVTSLRGATGWHLESVAGSVVALLGTAEPELRFNAYRIGSLDPALVRLGQAVAFATTICLILSGRRALARRDHPTRPEPLARPHPTDDPTTTERHTDDMTTTERHTDDTTTTERHTDDTTTTERHIDETTTAALVMVGAVAALIVTAPLLSPQFLLWLTPWAALARPAGGDGSWRPPTVAWPVGAATSLTGVTLAVFGPPSLDAAVPALLLLARDGCLVLSIIVAGYLLFRNPNRTVADGHPTQARLLDASLRRQ